MHFSSDFLLIFMNKLLNLRHWDFKPINYFIPNAKTYLKTCFLIKIFITSINVKKICIQVMSYKDSLFSVILNLLSDVRERII